MLTNNITFAPAHRTQSCPQTVSFRGGLEWDAKSMKKLYNWQYHKSISEETLPETKIAMEALRQESEKFKPLSDLLDKAGVTATLKAKDACDGFICQVHSPKHDFPYISAHMTESDLDTSPREANPTMLFIKTLAHGFEQAFIEFPVKAIAAALTQVEKK